MSTLCPRGSTILSTSLSGLTYQWQVDAGSGFTDIIDNSNYTGTNTANLQLNNIPSAWYGYKYRCVVDNIGGNEVTVTFADTWTGTVDNSWENPGNWSCGELPDANTDVIINSGIVNVNSNPIIRSLTLGTGISFTINPDFILLLIISSSVPYQYPTRNIKMNFAAMDNRRNHFIFLIEKESDYFNLFFNFCKIFFPR